jgi:FKBP-type peptidyl-prolyl cis-trans isomerase FkpA
MRRLVTFVTLAALTTACGDADEQDPTEVTRSYAPALNVDLDRMERTDSGLYIEDIREGTGEPLVAGQTAIVHYTGWLPDGNQFDSSRVPDRGPFDVTVGAGRVIPGWDEGLQGMRVGGQRRLVIPPALAYGTSGAGGVIPPNATLVFDVELVEIR